MPGSEKSANTALLLRAVACVKSSNPQQAAAAVKLPQPDTPLVKDLSNGLHVVYLVDEGDHFIYVQNRHLAESDFSAEGLHECALNNLGQRSEGKARIQPHGPLHAVLLDGNLEASLVLLDHLWDETLKHMAPNGFVAALPARDVLAFCDAESREGVEALRGMVQRVFQGGDHLLTRSLYRRRDGNWEAMN